MRKARPRQASLKKSRQLPDSELPDSEKLPDSELPDSEKPQEDTQVMSIQCEV